MKSALEYIKARFIEYGGGNESADNQSRAKPNFKDKDAERHIFVHVTVATNKDNVDKVFTDVQQIVVAEGLRINNLL